MTGTKKGGKLAAATNKAKYGEDFYKRMGQIGGKIGRTGGFASEEVGADGLTGKERAKKMAMNNAGKKRNKYGDNKTPA